MNFWQRLAHKLLHREYIMLFEGSSGMTHKVKRVFLIHGHYFLKETMGWVPLRKDQMAHTVYELCEANKNLTPGSLLQARWAPLTDSLLAYFKMLPDNQQMSQGPDGVRFAQAAGGGMAV